MPHPDYVNIEALRVRFKRKSICPDGISGSGAHAWGNPRDEEEMIKPMTERILPLLVSFFWRREPLPDRRDLVTVHQPQNLDRFTRWVKQEWTPFWHNYLRRRPRHRRPSESGEEFVSSLPGRVPKEAPCANSFKQNEAVHYRESMMLKFTSVIATVVACLLPTAAIGILTTAKTTPQKLGYIAGFTAIFAIGLMWLTDAGTSRANIFMATAT